MEHVPLPHGASIDPTERAPYIAEEYDGGPFLDYPNRSHFIQKHKIYLEDGLPDINLSGRYGDEFWAEWAIFLQTWLFFGLLNEFFGDAAPAEEFVDRQHDLPYALLTTARLPIILNRWVAGLKIANHQSIDRHFHLNQCLMRASYTIFNAVQWPQKTQKSVLFTIIALRDTLEAVLLLNTPAGATHQTFGNIRDEVAEYFNTTSSITMKGWCPTLTAQHGTARFQNTLSTYYVSKMSQPGASDHTKCTSTACVSQKSPGSGKIFKHRCSAENCEIVWIDAESLNDILGRDHTALLELSTDEGDGSLSINVVSSEDCASYVAISHVWSDGLGNSHANALPTCQVMHVAKGLRQIHGQGVFGSRGVRVWLDTLCCPVTSNYHRNLCLKRMDQIYREASHVLILDPPLAELRKADISPLEVCARMMMAGWTKRLWTLQEGILARNLLVQLQDGVVDLDKVVEDVHELNELSVAYAAVTVPFWTALWELRSMIPLSGQSRQGTGLIHLISALEGRSVTVAADETLCLCTCMGIKQDSVVDAAPQKRMPVFWKSMASAGKTIPRSIIFHSEKRLSQKGFSWSPISLLNTIVFEGLSMSDDEVAKAALTDRGLLVTYAGCDVQVAHRLQPTDRQWYNRMFFPPPERKAAHMELRHATDGWFALTETKNVPLPLRHHIRDIIRDDGARKALIMNKPMESISSISAAVCSVGNISEESQGVNFFHTRTVATLTRESRFRQLMLEAAWHIVDNWDLSSRLLPSLKDPSEYSQQPILLELADLPNEAVITLHKLCLEAAADKALVEATSGMNLSSLANELIAAVLMVVGEQCGEITRAWPDSQVWCVD